MKNINVILPTNWEMNHILLLDTDMESGHGGASGRFRRYNRTALQYAFILDQVGIKK